MAELLVLSAGSSGDVEPFAAPAASLDAAPLADAIRRALAREPAGSEEVER